MNIQVLSGATITPWLAALAALRIRVFRDFPYLYDGDFDYEHHYLAGYANCPDSVFILACHDEEVVGCATGLPLAAAHAEFSLPFEHAGMNVGEIFYFGESVLERAHRGQGVGHAFFDQRETHARKLGFLLTTLCAVERETGHPLRPPGYRSLDGFWRKRGYRPAPGLTAKFTWKDIDQADETTKTMRYWLKDHRTGSPP